MRNLIADRYPIYAEADITVESRDVAHDVMVDAVLDALISTHGVAATGSAPKGPLP
jgi:hypothetical protein